MFGVVVFQRPDTHGGARRVDGQLVIDPQYTAGQRTGHHGAGAPGREGPVNPKSGPTVVDRGGRGGHQVVQRGPQFIEPHPGGCIGCHHRGTVQERSLYLLGDLQAGQVHQVVVGRPHLGEGDHAVGDIKQLKDSEVLFGLGLPALGGRHHKQAGVDGTYPGQHVLEKPHMARDVDQ